MQMSIKLKVILLSAVPVILTVLIMAVFFYFQITKLGNNEIESFERLMIASKKN
jgi:signal transduction histidine kinase